MYEVSHKLDIQSVKQFSQLEFLARQVVEGFITGLHKSPFHGFSVEFAEHRLYNSGESTRHIDWKLYARSEKLFIKRYEEETNLRCQIVLDVSSSMHFPLEGTFYDFNHFNKVGFSANAAACLIELLKRQRDAIGLSTFSDKVEKHFNARSTPVHLKLVYRELENSLNDLKTENPKNTNTAKALHEIAETIHKRSLVVIFSDMMDNREKNDEIFAALQHLRHNKHEIILFHVTDRKSEIEFDFENRPHRFIDMETGEEFKLNPTQIQKTFHEKRVQWQNELRMKCSQYKIDFVEADIRDGFHKVMHAYLVKRISMM